MDGPWQIRRARTADGRRLVPLERRCFGDPWSAEAFEDLLASPFGRGFIAERLGEVDGYLVARAVAGEGEILNLAVAPEVRGQGLGSRLLDAALTSLIEAGAREVFLEVREGNLTAQALYTHRGFRPIGRRTRYYRNPVEDAIVLRLALPGGA
jgi:[ribosomal protein S18]-alanine N-acetyltransferase